MKAQNLFCQHYFKTSQAACTCEKSMDLGRKCSGPEASNKGEISFVCSRAWFEEFVTCLRNTILLTKIAVVRILDILNFKLSNIAILSREEGF